MEALLMSSFSSEMGSGTLAISSFTVFSYSTWVAALMAVLCSFSLMRAFAYLTRLAMNLEFYLVFPFLASAIDARINKVKIKNFML